METLDRIYKTFFKLDYITTNYNDRKIICTEIKIVYTDEGPTRPIKKSTLVEFWGIKFICYQ